MLPTRPWALHIVLIREILAASAATRCKNRYTVAAVLAAPQLDTLQQGVEIQGGAAPEIQCMRLQKDLRGPSPLIVQQGEEFPFRVELGGSAELGQHLARDAVDAHAGPLRALAVAWIGDLPKQGDHAQLFQQNGVEGHFVQTVENLGRRARASFTLDRVDLNENGILRFALLDEGCDRRDCRNNLRPSRARRQSLWPGTWWADKPRRAERPV